MQRTKTFNSFLKVTMISLWTLTACQVQDKEKSNEASVENKTVEDPNETLRQKQLKFVNSRYHAFLCYDLTTFKNANSEEHHGRCNGTEPASLWEPKGLDIEQWAQTLIDAEMSGGVLTTKHHGGFCLWDSKYTDYDVASSKDSTDIVAEFVKVFRKKNLQVGLYISVLDYHHDINNGITTRTGIDFFKNQLTELLTNYGDIDYLVLDGWATWPTVPDFEDINYGEIYKHINSLQPNCVILNHTYESSIAHAEIPFEDAANKEYPYSEDYMRPTSGSDVIQKGWFWDDNDFPVIKDVDYILGHLKSYNDHNGVYILNAPITTSGVISEDVVSRLKEVADVWEKPADLKEPGEKWGFSYNVTENLAFQKPCTQSSTHHFVRDKRAYPRGELAVDGVTDSAWNLEQVSGTKEGVDNWWKVDLEETHPINEITVFSAIDEESKAMLKDFTVIVYDKLFKPVWSSQEIKETPNPSVTLTTNGKAGRYVKIVQKGEGQLRLAEVIVK